MWRDIYVLIDSYYSAVTAPNTTKWKNSEIECQPETMNNGHAYVHKCILYDSERIWHLKLIN